MSETFNFTEFKRGCRQLPKDGLPTSRRMSALHLDCEEILESRHPERSSFLDCKAGCGHCCVINVSVLLPEALTIVEHLEMLPDVERKELLARQDKLWRQIQGVDDEERIWMRKPCVFLDQQGSCSIYPVRPLLCRGVTSTDAEDCKKVLNDCLENEGQVVQMNLFQRELYDAAYIGLSEGLEEQGIDGRGFEVTGIVRYLIRNPQQRDELKSGLKINWSDMVE